MATRDHSKCCCSTGIHDGLTYGQGKLDPNGFWEHPCWECARKAEVADGVVEGEYWPFPLGTVTGYIEEPHETEMPEDLD